MEQTRVWVVVIGLLLVTSMAGLGYWLGVRVEQGATAVPPPSPTPTVQGAVTELPPAPATTSEMWAGALRAGPPTTAPYRQEVFSTPTPPPNVVAPTIVLEDVPLSVRLGLPLRVRWQILGGSSPAVRGVSTRLLVSIAGTPESIGPQSGPYTLPARFEAVVTPQKRGRFLLVAEAVIAGQKLYAERPVTVE